MELLQVACKKCSSITLMNESDELYSLRGNAEKSKVFIEGFVYCLAVLQLPHSIKYEESELCYHCDPCEDMQEDARFLATQI